MVNLSEMNGQKKWHSWFISTIFFFLQNCYPSFGRDLSTVFSTFEMNQLEKIRPHGWKESLKLISKIAKFESDLLKTSEDIAPQSREILQTLARCAVQTLPQPYKHLCIFASSRSFVFVRLRRITFKRGKFTFCDNFKALFLVVSTDFANCSWSKRNQKMWKWPTVYCANQMAVYCNWHTTDYY